MWKVSLGKSNLPEASPDPLLIKLIKKTSHLWIAHHYLKNWAEPSKSEHWLFSGFKILALLAKRNHARIFSEQLKEHSVMLAQKKREEKKVQIPIHVAFWEIEEAARRACRMPFFGDPSWNLIRKLSHCQCASEATFILAKDSVAVCLNT